jgi:hypothetical protein
MMLLVIDKEGKSAYIRTTQFLPNSTIYHQAEGIKDMSSGRVVKKSKQGFAFDSNAPIARALRAHTKFGVSIQGEKKAMIWNIGYQAANGFTIPSKEVLLNYEVV